MHRCISFQNVTLDLTNLKNRPHSKIPEYFVGIEIFYERRDPNISTMDFIFHLVSKDYLKLQLLRIVLNLSIPKSNKYQVAFYLYGKAGTGKSTFVKFLIQLLGGSCTSLTIDQCKGRFGKYKAIGASLVIFDEIDSRGLTSTAVNHIKYFISGGSLGTAVIYEGPASLLGEGLMVFTSNFLWDEKKVESVC